MLNEQAAPTALGIIAQGLADALSGWAPDDQSDVFRATLAELTRDWPSVKQAAFDFGCSRRHFNRIAPLVGVRVGGQWRIDESRFQSLLAEAGKGKTRVSAAEIELWRLRARLIPARDVQLAVDRIMTIFERHFTALKSQYRRIYVAGIAGGEEPFCRELDACVNETVRAIHAELQMLADAENHGRKINV
ncbi:MAG: hypothetical protein WC689_00605 [Methylocystis sp.]|jgi:hypothetical protein